MVTYSHEHGINATMFKVLVIGDVRVGKTSFVHRLVNNLFKDNYKCTLGVDFALKTQELDDGKSVKLQLWDIAGSERATCMTRVYYKGASACILMFDITDRDSFLNCAKWKKDLDEKVFLPDDKSIPCLLLGNKIDLTKERTVPDNEIKSFAKENEFAGWRLCSVKENTGIHDGMKFLATTMVDRCNKIDRVNEEETGFSIDPDEEEESSRRCC